MRLIINVFSSIIVGILTNYIYDIIKPHMPILKKSVIKYFFVMGLF